MILINRDSRKMNIRLNSAQLNLDVMLLSILGLLSAKALALEIDDQANPTHAKQKIELQCGQHTVAITCGNVFDPVSARMGRQCNQNTLTFTGPDGGVLEPPPPKNKSFDFAGKTPVGLSCNKAKDGRDYVEVEYSSCLGNGNPCITWHLFTSTGKRLTADISDHMPHLSKATRRLAIDDSTPFIYIEGK